MDSRRLIAALVGVCALVLPAGASAAPTWHGVDAGVPASARLLSVAATRSGSDDVVVAVGRDEATGQAVIERLAHGVWAQDALPEGVAPAQLTRVVTGGGRAYAIGGSALLTLGDVNTAGPATWSAMTAPGAAELTAVAVAPDGSGGFLGAADGRLYSFTPAGAFTILNETQGQVVPPNGGVTAVAASSAGAGVAVAKRQDPGARFFALTQGGVMAQAAVDAGAGCGADPLAVAAAGAAVLAVDTACWWDRTNGVWSQHGSDAAFLLAGLALHDAALAPDASAAAIAGESGGQGTVWRRAGQLGWSAAVGASPAPLRGVAVVAADDMWAVGDGGAVLHLFTDPPPPADETSGDDGGASTSGGGDGSGSTSGSSQTTSSTSSSPRTPQGLTIVIDDDSGIHRESGTPTRTSSGDSQRPGRTPSRPRRLLRIIRVKAIRSGLRIDFRLAAPARVAAVAMRGKRTIGRVTARRLARGTRRIVLHYRGGKPPTTLRIVARRSDKTTTPARPAA